MMLPLESRSSAIRVPLLVPPEVTSDGTNLYWPAVCDKELWKHQVAATSAILEQFVALADSPVEKIVRFASKWGILCVCAKHGLPYEVCPGGCIEHFYQRARISKNGYAYLKKPFGWPHSPGPLRIRMFKYANVSPDYRYTWYETEPVWAWQHYAKHFRSILSLLSALHAGRTGLNSDWKELMKDDESWDELGYADCDSFSYRRHIICARIDELLDLAEFRIELTHDDRRFYTVFHSKSLYKLLPALTFSLVNQAASVEQYTFCSVCRHLYDTKRAPNPARLNYCSPECKKAGNAAAARRHRRHQRELSQK